MPIGPWRLQKRKKQKQKQTFLCGQKSVLNRSAVSGVLFVFIWIYSHSLPLPSLSVMFIQQLKKKLHREIFVHLVCAVLKYDSFELR